jgi:hypothetical protein
MFLFAPNSKCALHVVDVPLTDAGGRDLNCACAQWSHSRQSKRDVQGHLMMA